MVYLITETVFLDPGNQLRHFFRLFQSQMFTGSLQTQQRFRAHLSYPNEFWNFQIYISLNKQIIFSLYSDEKDQALLATMEISQIWCIRSFPPYGSFWKQFKNHKFTTETLSSHSELQTCSEEDAIMTGLVC